MTNYVDYIKNLKNQYEKHKPFNRKVYKGNEQAMHGEEMQMSYLSIYLSIVRVLIHCLWYYSLIKQSCRVIWKYLVMLKKLSTSR